MSAQDLTLRGVMPAAPSTQRAVPVRMDAHKNTVAYGSGSCVVVQQLQPLGGKGPTPTAADSVLICSLHKAAVTAVRFSPTGSLIASGDQNGCLIIFANKTGTLEKFRGSVLQGAIRDIAWTGDEERLVVVGEGKSCVGVAISNTGNALGTINGHSRSVLSCDTRLERPFRAFTGSADSFVGFYEGAPFVFTTNTPGHTGTVNCVRYCAATNEVATCSGLAELLILDGTTGAVKRRVPTAHTGTVYAVAWSPDGRAIATASADKHVHIIRACDGAVQHRVKHGTAVTDMQQGIVWTESAGVVSVSLRGTLAVMDAVTGRVDRSQAGHQGRVLFLHVCSGSGDLLSLSAEGKLIRWWGASGWRTNAPVTLPATAEVVNCATLGQNGRVYAVAGPQVLVYDAAAPVKANAAVAGEVTVLAQKGADFAPAVAVTAKGDVALVFRGKIVLLDAASGTRRDEVVLPAAFNASTATGHDDRVFVGGDRSVRVFAVGAGGKLTATGVEFTGSHTGSVSCIAVDKEGTRVASADGTSRSIFVWSPATGQVVVRQPMCHHSAAVTAMAFDGHRLLSGGLDCTLIVWDLSAPGRREMQDATHRGGVSAAAWSDKPNSVASAGGDYCIRQWSW